MLRKTAETESLLAPTMEIIGFHKMAMALNDICMQARLYNSGNGHVVEAAQEIVDGLPTGEQLNLEVEKVIGDLFGENFHEDVTKMAEPKMFMREGAIEPDTMPNEILRMILRQKTIGAIAKKLHQFDILGLEGIPMDIIGATVLAEREDQIPVLFQRALLGITSDPRYQLHPSPSRKHAIHVQGSKEFCDRLPIGAIKKIAGQDWEPKITDGFQVAKITFFHNDMPFETQIITEAGRVENNLGERTSHISYKAIKSAKQQPARQAKEGGVIETGLGVDTTGWGEILRQIHSCRSMMKMTNLNEQGLAAANLFSKSLASNSTSMNRITEKLRKTT
jgi:hypothetical protein